jgi:hypothetical protein
MGLVYCLDFVTWTRTLFMDQAFAIPNFRFGINKI